MERGEMKGQKNTETEGDREETTEKEKSQSSIEKVCRKEREVELSQLKPPKHAGNTDSQATDHSIRGRWLWKRVMKERE